MRDYKPIEAVELRGESILTEQTIIYIIGFPCLVFTTVRFRGEDCPEKGRETTMNRDSELELAEDSQTGGIPLETLLETIYGRFEHVAEIHAAHLPTLPDVSELWITVHAGDAESFEEYLDVSSATHVIIDTGDEAPLRLPYTTIATFDGPGHAQGTEGTTVYMAETVFGANPRDMETGLTRLRQKLSGICPICGEQVEGLRQHYDEKRACAEADF